MSETDKRPECKICFKRFSRTANLTKHLRIHNDDKPFQCEVCHKRFTNASNLIRHCMTHTGERNYQCDMCSMKFTDPSNLRRHVLMHTSRKAYQCEVCFKNFSSISNLQTHSRIHTGDKPYECDVCTRSFTQSYDLKLHQYVHTGERPFICDYCPKTYSHPSNLRKHLSSHYREMTFGKKRRGRAAKNVQQGQSEEMLAVNDIRDIYDANDIPNSEETLLPELESINETGEIPFEDFGQNKSNDASPSDANPINDTDKDYKCDVCKKGFSTLSNLQFHVQKHRGNKPYECSICNRGFSQFYDLKLHRYVHTGERPFTCDLCTKCYSHPSNLRKHRKTHSLDASANGKKGKKRKVNNKKQDIGTNNIRQDNSTNYNSQDIITNNISANRKKGGKRKIMKTNKKGQDISTKGALLKDTDKNETEDGDETEIEDINAETGASNSDSYETRRVITNLNNNENSEVTNCNEDIVYNLVYNIIEILTHKEIYGT